LDQLRGHTASPATEASAANTELKGWIGFGGGGWTRTNDLRIMRSVTPVAGQEDKTLSSAESGKVLQSPQPSRNQEQPESPNKIREESEKGGTPST